jgi:hypothetical protein
MVVKEFSFRGCLNSGRPEEGRWAAHEKRAATGGVREAKRRSDPGLAVADLGF